MYIYKFVFSVGESFVMDGVWSECVSMHVLQKNLPNFGIFVGFFLADAQNIVWIWRVGFYFSFCFI